MIVLAFNVVGNNLRRTDTNKVVSVSRNNVTAAFEFNSEWDSVTPKVAQFANGEAYYDAFIEDGKCTVPWEVLENEGTLTVAVSGGDLITTNAVKINVYGTGLVGGLVPTTASPGVYSEITKLAGEINDDYGNMKSIMDTYQETVNNSMTDISELAANAHESEVNAAGSAAEAKTAAEGVTSLKTEINNKVGRYEDLEFTVKNGLFNSSTKAIDVIGDNYRNILCEVTEGTRYHIHGIAAGNKNYSTYAFYDDDMTLLFNANDVGSNITDYDVTAPSGAAFVSVNGYRNNNKLPYIKKWTASEYADSISYDEIFKTIATESFAVSMSENEEKLIASTLTENTNSGGKYAVADCIEESFYLITGYNWNTMYPLFIFTDGTNKINDVYQYNDSIESGVYTSCIVKSPKYAKKLYVNGRKTDDIKCISLGLNPLSLELDQIKNSFEAKFNEIENELNGSASKESTDTLSCLSENLMNKLQIESHKNPFAYACFDKAYVTFCFDDGISDIDYVASIFDEFDYPLCLAVPPARINSGVTGLSDKSLGSTVKDIMNYVVDQGGEILCHDTTVLTENNADDKDILIEKFIRNKALLETEGFNIRGIVLAGGADYITGKHTTYGSVLDKWVRANFEYSDLYGDTPEYYYPRIGLSSNTTAEISDIAESGGWKIFFGHSIKDTDDESILRTALQYCKDNNIEVVTYGYIYDNFSSTEFNERLKNLEKKSLEGGE